MLNESRLAALINKARDTCSDALVLFVRGKLYGQWYFGQLQGPIEAMSVTKSIASLAIACLLSDGRLSSLDARVCDFYPQWKWTAKRRIKIIHILTHTSGLRREDSTDVLYSSSNVVNDALESPLEHEPGEKFLYNNLAVNLLAGIVKVITGCPLDDYLRDRLFTPLGIVDYHWARDPAGHSLVMAGLEIRAIDLAKIGLFLLQGGEWNGDKLLPSGLVRSFVRPASVGSPHHGLLWWMVPKSNRVLINREILASWRSCGIDENVIIRMASLVGQEFEPTAFDEAAELALGGQKKWKQLVQQFKSIGVPYKEYVPHEICGYCAEGWLGQYLVVLADEKIVAVRQRREGHGALDNMNDFPDFIPMLCSVVYRAG
jgi:CubicO group peptidase (beta-lactamase class C family)